MADRKKIGEILVELQVLTPTEVDSVLTAMRRRHDRAKFGRAACEMGLMRDEHILAALAVQMQLFPNIQDLSLNKLLGRLRDPVRTPPRIPVRKVRRLLACVPRNRQSQLNRPCNPHKIGNSSSPLKKGSDPLEANRVFNVLQRIEGV